MSRWLNDALQPVDGLKVGESLGIIKLEVVICYFIKQIRQIKISVKVLN